MNQSEHRLIIEMLQQQTVAFAALVEVLKQQGIVQEGDLDAYHEMLDRSGKLTLVQDQAAKAYQESATRHGVETGIDPDDLP
jgi:hypothetical protein